MVCYDYNTYDIRSYTQRRHSMCKLCLSRLADLKLAAIFNGKKLKKKKTIAAVDQLQFPRV